MVALQQHLVPLPQIERCHDRDRVMSPTAQLKERLRKRKQAVFREASLNADVHSVLLRDERKGHSFRKARNVPETGQLPWIIQQPITLFPSAGRMRYCLARLSREILNGRKIYITNSHQGTLFYKLPC